MQEKSIVNKSFRWKKFWLRTAAVILVFLCVFPFALDAYLKNKLPDIINEKTPYAVKFGQFDLSLLQGNLDIEGVEVFTKNPKDASINQVKGTIGHIKITNFRILKALFNKAYFADDFRLVNPKIDVVLAPKKDHKSTTKVSPNIKLNNVFVQNAQFNIKDISGKPVLLSTDLNLDLEGISFTNNNAKIPFAAKKFTINTKAITASINDFYQIKATSINAKNKHIEINDFHMYPTQHVQNFDAKSVFDLQMKQFLANGITMSNDSIISENTVFNTPYLLMTSTEKNVLKKVNDKDIELKIALNNLTINDGQVLMQKMNKEEQLSAENFNFKMSEIILDKNTMKEKVPFRFKSHDLDVSNLYFRMGQYQAIRLGKFVSNNQQINLEKLHLQALGHNPNKNTLDVTLDELSIKNNDTKFIGQKLNVKLGDINLDNPTVKMYLARQVQKSTKKIKKETPDFDFDALISSINLKNAHFDQFSADGSKKLSVDKVNLNLNRVTSNQKMMVSDRPFLVANHKIAAHDIKLDAGKYYNLSIKNISNIGKETIIDQLSFKSKYSRKAFSKIIKQQEDLYDITAGRIVLSDQLDLFAKHDKILLDKVILDDVKCSIYHDLAPPEDKSLRSMFNEKLRNIKVPLFINQVQLKNSYISYEEEAVTNNKPGKLFMDQFNATIDQVNNAKMSGKPSMVKIAADFNFYGSAPTHVDWNFDVANPLDTYTINGKITKLSANEVNLFVKPYLNITLDGDIHYLKFNYYGDKTKIQGDFLLNYNNLYVHFLNENTGENKKLLSNVANLLIRNNSKKVPDIKQIEKDREPTRSFFNMLWQGVMEGLKKTLI